jgi:two-component system CheB/CheR fusion protein
MDDSDLYRYNKKIFDDFPALIWRSGLDMGCDYFNNTWLAFTGRALEEELGNGWVEGVHPDDVDRCMEIYVSHFREESPFDMEYRLRNRAGEYRWIRDMGRPFHDLSDRFTGYIGSCYDITDEREREARLREVNEAKDKFFSIIAHDLIGPISSMESLIGIAQRDYAESYDKGMVTMMAELGKASAEIRVFLGDILDWAYSQLQGMQTSPSEFFLRELCAEAVQPLAEGLRIKGIRFENGVPDGIRLRADYSMVKTVVRNLVANALKFSRHDGVVRISATAGGGSATISVLDQGVGMSERELASLFDLRGVRRKKGTEGEGGTGLGLVICRDLIERNGGRIWAESEEGAGSAFSFTLPLA